MTTDKSRRRRWLLGAATMSALVLVFACSPRRQQRQPPPPYYGNPGYAPPQNYPPQNYPPQQQPPPPRPPAPAPNPLGWLGQALGAGPPPGMPAVPGMPGMPAQWPWPAPPGTQPPGTQPPGTQPPGTQPQGPPGAVGSRALDLANRINDYRAQNGLHRIPISRALTHVATTHANDLHSGPPMPSHCNGHSWSNRGAWSPCCYTSDHAQSECMWRKPGQLTQFNVTGYEISIGKPGHDTGYVLDGGRALELWKGSPGHHDVILNRGKWASSSWNAIGTGIIDSHACAWFTKEADPNR